MFVRRRAGLCALLFVAVSGCGGGGDGSDPSAGVPAPVPVVAAPAASATPTPEPTATPVPVPLPSPSPAPIVAVVVTQPATSPMPSPTAAPMASPTPTPMPSPKPSPTPAPRPAVAIVAGQDMTVVGSNLWIFDKSDESHALKGGTIRRLSDLSYLGAFRHNISHAATANYFPGTDTAMIGNGGDVGAEGPRIDLFPAFSRYGVGSFLDWFNPASTPRISIPLFVKKPDGTALRSVFPSNPFGGRGNSVWVDARNIVVFGLAGTGLTATTVRLGMGGEDLSPDGFGTFLPGRGANEYNGTARAIRTYTSALVGTSQGGDWRNGRLYVGWTNAAVGRRVTEVLELELDASGSIRLVTDFVHLTRRADGSTIRFETQGVTFKGTELIVASINVDTEYHSIYRFDSATQVTDLYPR